jgi:RNA polymerase sigma factor (sigma-70 family)
MTHQQNSRDARVSDILQQTRRSLLSRLKNADDHEGWRQFIETYGRVVYNVAVRSGLTDAEAQDALQETMISVFKTMPNFKYDPLTCSFKTWLHHLAFKRIADQFRKRQPPVVQAFPSEPDGSSGTTAIERVPDQQTVDIDKAWKMEWQNSLFAVALERAKNQASVEQFQVFDLYVLKDWPVRQVASTLGISATQVYLAKHRVLRIVRRETKKLEREGI